MSGALPRPGVNCGGGGGGGGGSTSARTSIEAGDIGRGSDGGGSGSGGSDGPASTSVDPLRLLLRATASEDARAGVKDAGGPGTMRMGPAMLQMMGATKKRPAPTAAAATQAPGSPPSDGSSAPTAHAASWRRTSDAGAQSDASGGSSRSSASAKHRSPGGRKRPREETAATAAAAGASTPATALGARGPGLGFGSGSSPGSATSSSSSSSSLPTVPQAASVGAAAAVGGQTRMPSSDMALRAAGGKEKADVGAGASVGSALAAAMAAAAAATGSASASASRAFSGLSGRRGADAAAAAAAGGLASSPQQRQRQQMLSVLLAGLPPEAQARTPSPSALLMPSPTPLLAHPALQVRDPVAEAVAASREAIFRGVGLLAGQQKLDRGRTEAFLRLLTFLSQAQQRDCSVGVAGLLSYLLQSQPHVFHQAGGPHQPPPQQRALTAEEGRELLERLTTKEGSCHIVGTPAAAGGDAIVCSVRMVELFVCPQHLSTVLLYTGVASFFLWPLFLCKGPGLEDLYAAIMSLLLEPVGRPQIDIFLQCRTRQGSEVRCLATVGAQIIVPGCTGSFIALRLVTLG